MSPLIPRLEPDALDPALAAVLAPRVERLGYLGEFFRVMGHQPRPLRAFVELTETAKEALDKRLVEVVALTAAVTLGNDYERNQHERLCLRLGFGRDWVVRVERRRPEALAGEEGIVQAWVLAALRDHGRGAGPELEVLVRALGQERTVAVMMVLGRYAMHALIVNALGLAPPVPSVFEDGFSP
jgi:alkylhydroperoxidase family enzyme